MSLTDWAVLIITLFSIVLYGMWKSRGAKNISGFLLADKQLPWYHVGLSVMATQASAITFLSAPGQAYTDGLRFVQFYFGLPLAMVVLCITFIPMFRKLNVYTAYEFLEKRFDKKTRLLTAFLFLLQRGLSTGITIYAPAIILSTILQVDITYTIIFNGAIVILYTVYGGARAVSYTQMLQMAIIFTGLFLAAYMVVHLLPENVGFIDALQIAGKMDKLNAIDTHFDINNRYNIWSGIIGGFFLQLSYFGTDQSQVGRYLTGSSVTQSRLGLIMNGLVKIPMQFLILLIGVLVFAFYQYHQPPVFFNSAEVASIKKSIYKDEYREIENRYKIMHEQKQKLVEELTVALHENNKEQTKFVQVNLQEKNKEDNLIRAEVMKLVEKNNPKAQTNDGNYIFLHFVTHQLPVGVVGLLIAIIFLASMGSTASGLNSLASATVIDFYKRIFNKAGSDKNYLNASRWATFIWGVFCIIVALYAGKLGNLIEVVNILGSLFYGTILGIFLVAFYMKKISGSVVFIAAIITEIFVVIFWLNDWMAFLWLNVAGCLLLMLLAALMQFCIPKKQIVETVK
jgi:SSS family solute:Na+ symporter